MRLTRIEADVLECMASYFSEKETCQECGIDLFELRRVKTSLRKHIKFSSRLNLEEYAVKLFTQVKSLDHFVVEPQSNPTTKPEASP